MKGATPVPGPTIMMGAEGSSGKRKECVARGEINIWNIEPALVSAKTIQASTDEHLTELMRVCTCQLLSEKHHSVIQQHQT